MNRLATAAFVSLMAVVALVAYRVEQPRALVTEADNRDLLAGIATNQAAQMTANAPPPTATVTPTRTPKPPTATAYPSYAPDAAPGFYLVPAWTPTSTNKGTVEPGIVPCVTVTPDPHKNQYCEVAA
jgi:hypothetical protein